MSQPPSQPLVDRQRCTQCRRCVQVCPMGAVTFDEQGPVFNCPPDCQLDQASCFLCLCEEMCPQHAISWAFEICCTDSEIAL